MGRERIGQDRAHAVGFPIEIVERHGGRAFIEPLGPSPRQIIVGVREGGDEVAIVIDEKLVAPPYHLEEHPGRRWRIRLERLIGQFRNSDGSRAVVVIQTYGIVAGIAIAGVDRHVIILPALVTEDQPLFAARSQM
jgi:hypothetical protein